ncbi:histidine--tRNA ligase [Candidatus Collierbacteria bacterium]|nr:histidine--tRNA ligase [Candidatus Collierbacteria bacterium]
MTNTPQLLKGFRDFLPKEASKRQWLKEKIRLVCESWGFEPLETPTLEPLELFEGQVGEDEKLFFKFEDQGGRKVALRYDQTVPTCRVVGQNYQQLAMPFKRYQIQPAFRAEKPQKGRYREFLQCDADIFGDDSPFADAEVIALSLDIYRRLGFKQVKALINNRELVKDLPYPAIAAIDKLKKIGEEGVISEMKNKGIAENAAKGYLDLMLNLKPDETINIILKSLENYGFDKSWYAFEPTIARSFSYSTGPIWEIVIPGFESGSVLGGERFDKLVENVSGVKIPGTGFGLGFDRTLEAAEQFGLIPDIYSAAKTLITVFSPELQLNSVSAAAQIRDQGINAEIYTNPSAKLDKQLKYADKKRIPYVVIIGPEEIAKGIVTLKNMKEKTQQTITIKELPAHVP